ncbi:hypothetical protein ACVITL_004815, partial [Rhizobium pisi]
RRQGIVIWACDDTESSPFAALSMIFAVKYLIAQSGWSVMLQARRPALAGKGST